MDEPGVLNRWQIEEIKKALAEADHEDFATDDEVQQTFRKGRNSVD